MPYSHAAEVMFVPWHLYYRKDDDGHADCGIVTKNGYSVCRCPKYVSHDDWKVIAQSICDAHNRKVAPHFVNDAVRT